MILNRGRSWSRNYIWIWLGVILATLVIVTSASIRTGPSADEAIVAIRVAQRDLFEARKIHRVTETTALNDAEAALILAWDALKERRYEEAILEAHKVSALARKVQGQMHQGSG